MVNKMKRVRGFACIGTAIVVFCLLTVRPFWGRMVIEGIQQSDQNHRETEEKKVADVDQWIKDGSATVTYGNKELNPCKTDATNPILNIFNWGVDQVKGVFTTKEDNTKATSTSPATGPVKDNPSALQ